MTDAQIADTLHALLAARAPSASICPSEVARALAPEAQAWRALMPEVRRVASALAADGMLVATRGGEVVDPLSPGGPIRLRRTKS